VLVLIKRFISLPAITIVVILSFFYKAHVLENLGDTSSQTLPQVLSDMTILCVLFMST